MAFYCAPNFFKYWVFSTFFIANLSDENGINLSNIGINTTLRFILDDSIEYLVPEFYRSDVDDHTSGWVYYPVDNIQAGTHHLTIIGADAFGNVAQKTTNFRVIEENEFVIEELKNYPNPFRDRTQFTFSHNRAGESLEVDLSIMSTSGRHVENIHKVYEKSPGTIALGFWTRGASDGGKVLPGLYVYRLIVRSLNDGSKSQKVQKLLIIN